MLNLVIAELYRLLNRKYLIVFWGILVLIALLSTFFVRIPFNQWLSISMPALLVPVFLWPIITDVVAGEEFKENTISNTASFGISKIKFFLSKVVVSAVLVIITVFVTVFTFTFSAWLLSPNGVVKDGITLSNYIQTVLAIIPLYFATITICTLLTFTIQRQSLATFVYIGLFSVNPLAVLMGASDYIPGKKYFITTQIFDLLGSPKMVSLKTSAITMNTLGGSASDNKTLLFAVGVGLLYLLVFSLIGALANRKWN